MNPVKPKGKIKNKSFKKEKAKNKKIKYLLLFKKKIVIKGRRKKKCLPIKNLANKSREIKKIKLIE